jgi:hypothetical protein
VLLAKTFQNAATHCHATEKSEAIACARSCWSSQLTGWWTQKEKLEKWWERHKGPLTPPPPKKKCSNTDPGLPEDGSPLLPLEVGHVVDLQLLLETSRLGVRLKSLKLQLLTLLGWTKNNLISSMEVEQLNDRVKNTPFRLKTFCITFYPNHDTYKFN